MTTRYKNARTLDGRDIGRLIEQSVTRYNRELKSFEPARKEWFPILMITHKKNGNVRIRTGQPYGRDVEFTGTTELVLKDAK